MINMDGHIQMTLMDLLKEIEVFLILLEEESG